MKKTVKAGVLNLCIFLLSLLILVPVCIVVLNSFKTQGEAASFTLSLPTKWIMDNYREVLPPPISGDLCETGSYTADFLPWE